MKYTPNFGLPLYEYRDDADLVEGYNKTAEFIDSYLSDMSSISTGSGAPSNDGSDGDVYIDTDAHIIYVWTTRDDGTIGWTPVITSDRPSMWFTGAGDPVSGTDYRKNDMYLDTETANVWMYVGEPSEDLVVDTNASPIRLMQNGKIIGRNWFYRQGTVSVQIEGAVGSRDIIGDPSAGGETKSVRLPISAYVTPFEIHGSVSEPYDLYYRLSARGFDSGRHLEHHDSDQHDILSEAEVAIVKPSTYSSCIFTIDPGDGVGWDGDLEITTHGLYQAYDYATMLSNGVKWFDHDGHIEYTTPWVLVCNLAPSVTGTCHMPAGGNVGDIMVKSSKDDYDVAWRRLKSSEVLYTHNGQSTVASAIDDLYVRSQIQTSDSDPIDGRYPISSFDKTPYVGSLIITPSGDIYRVTNVTDTDVIVEKTTTNLTGPRGTGIFSGADYPESTVSDPKAGDLFVSTSTYDLYQYQFSIGDSVWKWSVIGNIRGANGDKGDDGITPHIGDNGNWFIGDEDTGVKAAVTANDLTYGDSTVADELDNINVNLTEIENEMRSHRQVPDDGADGQLLKMVGSDYEWADPPDIATDDEAREFLDIERGD